MRWLPALICWIALPLVSAPALAVGGAGTLGALTNDGVGLPTTLTLGDLVVDQTFTHFGELETLPIAVPTACADRLDLEPLDHAAYCGANRLCR